jgi:uncharacterized membrane protein YqiK
MPLTFSTAVLNPTTSGQPALDNFVNDILSGMNQSTAFVILAFLLFVAITVGGLSFRQWLAVRKAQIDNADKNAQREADTIKYRADLEAQTARSKAELEASTAKYQAEAEQRQYEKEKVQAGVMIQIVAALDAITNAQKRTSGIMARSEQRIITAGTTDTGVITSIIKSIVSLVGDNTIAINAVKAVLQELVEQMKDTPGGAEAVVVALQDVSTAASAPPVTAADDSEHMEIAS